jgi:hypothetical protein
MPVWDTDEEPSWNAPPERFATPGTEAMPPAPDPAAQNLGAPAPYRRPFEPDTATQRLGGPGTGPMPPPGYDPAGWNQNVPPTSGQAPAGWNQNVPPTSGPVPAGPAGPAASADGSTGKSRKIPLLVGGIAAVAVLGGGLVYALTQGVPWSNDQPQTAGGKAGAGSSARQAAAVNQILKSGKTAHGHLPSRVRTCDDVSAGVPGFQQVVQDRQQELSQSKGLAVDRLGNGSRLRRSMIAAYQSSLAADQAYLAWAREIQARGCGSRVAPLTAHYKDAISANGKAGPAKRQVVALWKPIANSHGLPKYAWNRL